MLTGFYLLFTGRRLPKRPEDTMLARSSRAWARSSSCRRWRCDLAGSLQLLAARPSSSLRDASTSASAR
ncbi:MAG: hypothetical protein ACRDNT_20045 [Streptosporangiaceae bacterium]